MVEVRDKELTPSKFSLGSKVISKQKLISTIETHIAGNYSPAVVEYCNYLVENSSAGKDNFPDLKTRLDNKDVNIILKDFGELTGALYLMTIEPRYVGVKYPPGSEKLIDYIMVTEDGLEEKYSAKAGAGGKPSLVSVMPIINKMSENSKLPSNQKRAIKVIQLVSTEERNGLYLGPLLAANYLQTPGYKALLQVLRSLKINYSGIPSQIDLQTAVDKTGSFNNMKKLFNPFFNAANYTLNEEVTKRLFETPKAGSEKVWGVLHYPITAELVKWLNQDRNGAKEVLTKAANSLSVNQIYLDAGRGNIKYTVKSFSGATFQFGSPSSMPRPTNNRIGFTMVKSMKEVKK